MIKMQKSQLLFLPLQFNTQKKCKVKNHTYALTKQTQTFGIIKYCSKVYKVIDKFRA
jgi:hypothetical protein